MLPIIKPIVQMAIVYSPECEDEENEDDDDDDNDDEDVVRITMSACHVAAAATSPEHDCRLRTLRRRIRWMFACLLVMVV